MKLNICLIFLIVFFDFIKTNACSCIGQRTVEQELKHSDAVVTGKVISSSIIVLFDSVLIQNFKVDSSFAKTTLIRNVILIDKIYKGKIKGDTLIIYTGVGGGDCGIKFKIGQEYIVYGEKESYLSDKGGRFVYPKEKNSYWTYLCMRTGLFEKSEIDEIEKFIAARTIKQSKYGKDKHTKINKAEIIKQVALIDSLRFEKAFRVKAFKSQSECATNVLSYYTNDSLKYLYSFNSNKFYSSITHAYFKNNEVVKISFYEQIPEWEKYYKNYKKETDNFRSLTFSDKTFVYYFLNPIETYELIEGKEVKCIVNKAEYQSILACVNILIEESKQ